MYVVGLNGPPGCGKDTLAHMLVEHMESQGVETPIMISPFSLPLRFMAFSMVGDSYSQSRYEDFKRRNFPAFNRTGRQLMIDVSESFLKPMYGMNCLARMKIEQLKAINFDGLVIMPDCGFMIEVSSLRQDIGANNLYVVRIHRDKCSFNNDSREWVYSDHDTDLDNDGTLDDLRTEAGRIYGRLVNNLHWQL